MVKIKFIIEIDKIKLKKSRNVVIKKNKEKEERMVIIRSDIDCNFHMLLDKLRKYIHEETVSALYTDAVYFIEQGDRSIVVENKDEWLNSYGIHPSSEVKIYVRPKEEKRRIAYKFRIKKAEYDYKSHVLRLLVTNESTWSFNGRVQVDVRDGLIACGEKTSRMKSWCYIDDVEIAGYHKKELKLRAVLNKDISYEVKLSFISGENEVGPITCQVIGKKEPLFYRGFLRGTYTPEKTENPDDVKKEIIELFRRKGYVPMNISPDYLLTGLYSSYGKDRSREEKIVEITLLTQPYLHELKRDYIEIAKIESSNGIFLRIYVYSLEREKISNLIALVRNMFRAEKKGVIHVSPSAIKAFTYLLKRAMFAREPLIYVIQYSRAIFPEMGEDLARLLYPDASRSDIKYVFMRWIRFLEENGAIPPDAVTTVESIKREIREIIGREKNVCLHWAFWKKHPSPLHMFRESLNDEDLIRVKMED